MKLLSRSFCSHFWMKLEVETKLNHSVKMIPISAAFLRIASHSLNMIYKSIFIVYDLIVSIHLKSKFVYN